MKLRYFGILSEMAGKTEEEIEFAGTIQDLRIKLHNLYPAFKDQHFQVAVDQKMVNNDYVLDAAAEIALLPPFTGG